jgi:hypothetical protein
MAQADSADTTILPALSGNSAVHKLCHMPAGLSTERPVDLPPVDLPPVDRSALMRRAHEIARKFRPHVASYREALQYGRKGAWGLVATAREFTVLSAQVPHRTITPEQIATSRTATHRCGVFAPVARGPPSGAGARRRAVPKAGPPAMRILTGLTTLPV